MRYILITPAKNEANHIRKTIESVIKQTIKPVEWIIVDDGSTDNMAEIVRGYALRHDWMKLVQLQNTNEERSGGSKVVRAFNEGYKRVSHKYYDIIVKLDADLILPPNYFEEIIILFKKEEKLGLAGGIILNKIGDRLVVEGSLDYHVRGAFKAYRRTCFEDIGGFKEIWNWDGLDEMEAMFKGWQTKTIDLKVIHLRPTTSAYNRSIHAYKSGIEAYKMRMSFILMLMRVIYWLPKDPIIIKSFYYLKGYLYALIYCENFIIEKDLGRFINRFHLKRFF